MSKATSHYPAQSNDTMCSPFSHPNLPFLCRAESVPFPKRTSGKAAISCLFLSGVSDKTGLVYPEEANLCCSDVLCDFNSICIKNVHVHVPSVKIVKQITYCFCSYLASENSNPDMNVCDCSMLCSHHIFLIYFDLCGKSELKLNFSFCFFY